MEKHKADCLGKLFLVSTPIGHFGDMTFRAVETLSAVDLIYCEDTRRTMSLLKHFKIQSKNPLMSFHNYSTKKDLDDIKKKLKAGHSLAYCSDAGTPNISDPGYLLVRLAFSLGAEVIPVPGVSSVSTFMSVCHLPSPKFLFHGFFPRKQGEIESVMDFIVATPIIHIFFEAPSRFLSTLEILNRKSPDFHLFVGRELTKIHEEFIAGTPEDILKDFTERGHVLGEIVMGVLHQPKEIDAKSKILNIEVQEEIMTLLRSGLNSKEVSKEVGKKFNIPRRDIYDFIVRRLT